MLKQTFIFLRVLLISTIVLSLISCSDSDTSGSLESAQYNADDNYSPPPPRNDNGKGNDNDNSKDIVAGRVTLAFASSINSNQIDISWNGVPSATHYRLYSSTSETGTYNEIYSGGDTSYSNTGLNQNTNYYYKLRACITSDINSCSEYSSVVSAATKFLALDTPSAPNTLPQSSAVIDISWNGVPSATHYRLYSSTSETGTYNEIYSGGDTSYSNTGLNQNTNYYYKLRACITSDINSCSEYSSVVSAATKFLALDTPSAPNTLPQSSAVIDISWNGVPSATHYRLYSSTSETGTYNEIYSGGDTSYSNTGLNQNTNYYYKLRACITSDINSCSEYSSVVSAATKFLALDTPSAPNTLPQSSAVIDISWNGVPSATHYRLYSSTSETGTYNEIYSGGDTSYSNTGLNQNTNYYYKLRACITSDINSCSEYSSVVSAATKAALAKPAAPTLTATTSTQIDISLGGVPSATHYKLYSSTSETGTYVHIGTVQDRGHLPSSYSHKELNLETTNYYYKLKACNEDGQCSEYSDVTDFFSDLLSFTKFGADGKPLAKQDGIWKIWEVESPTLGDEANGTKWSCVKDNNTGLFWEVKMDSPVYDRVRRSSKIFQWGSSKTPAPAEIGGTHYNEWDALVDLVNGDKICGFDDWRVATVDELRTLVHFLSDTDVPLMRKNFFPYIKAGPGSKHWTLTPPTDADTAYYVSLYNKKYFSFNSWRGNSYYVRLVRGSRE